MTVHYSTLLLVSQLQGELERVLSEAAGAREPAEPRWPATEAPPPLDIQETENRLMITVEVPGLEAEELAIEINGKDLVVRGNRRSSQGAETARRFHCMERARGSFERLLRIDDRIDPRRATARLERGVLSIDLPKLRDDRRGGFRVPIDGAD